MTSSKKHLAKFEDVQAFFKSWGLYPSHEKTDDLNPETIAQGINRRCYEKMLADADRHINASKYSGYFSTFCIQQIDSVDDSFYLHRSRWSEIQEAWEEYVASL